MSKACKTCKGRGRWQERDALSLFDDTVYWNECNDCNGTGVEQDPEAGDDYDIGGDSYAEED